MKSCFLPPSLSSVVSLVAVATFLLWAGAPADAQERKQSDLHDHFLCGELPRGSGLRSGERGMVDRFNNPWRPEPWLTGKRSGPRRQSATCGGFRIDFEDEILGNGVGFDDRTPVNHPVLGAVTLGAVRRGTICRMFEYLGGVLEMKGSPDVIVRASQTDGGGFLAAASPFFRSGSPEGFTGGTVFDHITTGSDPTPGPGEYDAMIIFDFGPWGMGISINSDWTQDPGSAVDLFSVALHEATHTLGFLSLIRPDGTSGIGGWYSTFDARLRNGAGNPLVDPSQGKFIGSPGDLTSNGILFQGKRCGNSDPVYSPAAFAPGSSLSHFDSYRSSIRYVMRYATSGGSDRELTRDELRALCDIGYSMVGGACGKCLPVGNDDTASTFSGVEVTVDVLANDTDPDGGGLRIDPGTLSLTTGRGAVAIVNNTISFTPDADYTGHAYIRYHPVSASGVGGTTTLRVWVRRTSTPGTGLDSGLVVWLSFDDSTAQDNSGNGHHGEPYGGPVATPGVCGSAMSFDGVDDYIIVPRSPLLLGLKRMTLSYWIRFYNNGFGRNATGNTIGNGSDDRPGVKGFYTYSSKSEISHFLGRQPNARGIRMYYDATVPLQDQEFTFVTFTVSDDTLKVFRNGCLVEAISRDGWPIARDWDWYIAWSGDFAGDGGYLKGHMDEIRIHDRALSDDEILQLYEKCGGRVALASEPPYVDFGVLECPRTDTTVGVTIRNIAKDTLNALPTLRSGKAFSVVGGGPVDLAAGETARTIVRFNPPAPGYYSDTLVIAGDCSRLLYVPVFGMRDSCAESPHGRTDLMISKTVDDSIPYLRQQIVYGVTVTNVGPNPSPVEARDVVPAGLTVVGFTLSDPTASFDPVTGIVKAPMLAVGAFVRLDLTCSIDRTAPDTILNCAEVIHSGERDLDFTNDRACVPIVVRRYLDADDLDIGSVPWCLDSAGYVVMRNASKDTVQVVEIIPSAGSSFRVGIPDLPRLVVPSDTMRIPVLFAPTAEGPAEGSVNIVALRLPSGLPDTVEAILRGNGVVVQATAKIDSQYVPLQGTVRVPIRLLTPIDGAEIFRLRITLLYDSTSLFLLNGNSWENMTRGTLLEGWRLISKEHRPGRLVLNVAVNRDGEYLRGTGTLLDPAFQALLSAHVQTEVSVLLETPGRDCARLLGEPGTVLTDSICGLNLRLIEATSAITKLALRPVQPNPFSGSAEIRFQTPIDGAVRLELFDVAGNIAGVLVNGYLPAGEHAVTWDASAHASGIYECRLSLGGVARRMRLILSH